jgi:hypothetical protein
MGWQNVQLFAVFGHRAPFDFDAGLIELSRQSIIRQRLRRVFLLDERLDRISNRSVG